MTDNLCKTCEERNAYENAALSGYVFRIEKPNCGKCIADQILNNVFGQIPKEEQFDPLV